MVIAWNTGAAAARFRHNLKLKKKKRKKRQATSSKRSSFEQQGPGFPDSCNNLFDREIE